MRVVTANGDQLGIMNTREALEKAKALGLDLVEVASNADPPVCRVVDYGRYKYQQSKLQKTNKSRTIKLKEVKLRIGTDTNDYNVKMARTESFLDHGHKVRFQLRFRGRENAHHELGYDMLNKVIADMKTMAQVDQPPRLAGNTMHMVLAPLPAAQRVKNSPPIWTPISTRKTPPLTRRRRIKLRFFLHFTGFPLQERKAFFMPECCHARRPSCRTVGNCPETNVEGPMKSWKEAFSRPSSCSVFIAHAESFWTKGAERNTMAPASQQARVVGTAGTTSWRNLPPSFSLTAPTPAHRKIPEHRRFL